MDVPALIDEAQNALKTADPLCTAGDAYHSETKLLIEQTTVLYAKILFLHNAQQDQLRILKYVAQNTDNEIKTLTTKCKSKIKLLKNQRQELRQLLTILKQTPVHKAFGGHENLFEYIHLESTNMLELKVEDLINELNAKSELLVSIPVTINLKFTNFEKELPKLPTMVDTTTLQRLNKLSTKSGQLITLMAETLTSLTNNFDLASQIPELNEEDAKEATKVVMEDRRHVIEALANLETYSTKLKGKCNECQRLQHTLAMTLEQFVSFDRLIGQFISSDLKPSLISMQQQTKSCDVVFEQIGEVVTELKSLSEYYRLFKKSYGAMIEEVDRRRESNKQLEKLVANVNNALHGFVQREMDARSEFLSTYAEYIPEDIWPGMTNMPGELKVELVSEDLPDVQGK